MTANTRGTKADQEKELMRDLWAPEITDNPYNFVMYAFPWGKENTPLHDKPGPRTWQRDEMEAVAEHIKNNRALMALQKDPKVYESSTVSGRGPGKSALVSMFQLWMMTCNLGATNIVTANNETQLKSRTWAELGKWHTMMINSHWFERTTMALKPAAWFEESLRNQLKIDTGYFYSMAQLWSEENPDGFAGVHNHHGISVTFDEASGIPEKIWTVTEGFFTDPVLHRYWFNFSNGRRNTGRFYEQFHKYRDYGRRTQIDSRNVEGTDKEVLNRIIEKYGEDSDEARIEVKGEFPRQGDSQFISREVVEAAQTRDLIKDGHAPIIMGIDVARFGDDSSCFRFRQGRDARSIQAVKFKGLDNMQLAAAACEWIDKINPDAICVDLGSGAGVIDRLRSLGHKVHEVNFGAPSPIEELANVRIELWDKMLEWLNGGCIDDDPQLKDDLVGPNYLYDTKDRKILEPKDKMKKRGLASPDNADALALTFAVRPARKDGNTSKKGRRNSMATGMDYPIFSR